jgi:18S rRNA (guanine1575-N7)-methyltransferase
MAPKRDKRPTPAAYYGTEAEEYGQSQWMARNQRRTTEVALQLLVHESLGECLDFDPIEAMALDIGCGTGYSSERIMEEGFRTVGLEVSRDMMHEISPDVHPHLIQADMRHLPLRSEIFNIAISISAFNFAGSGAKNSEELRTRIHDAVTELHRILETRGRSVIEFYPTPSEEQVFLNQLKIIPFIGGLLTFNPLAKKEQKFLVLKKESQDHSPLE